MKYTIVLAAFAAAVAVAPVRAQPVSADFLPPHEVASIVTSMGLRMVGRPAWTRGRYVVAAVDRRGREVNVVLDGFDGRVIAVRPIGGNGFDAPPRVGRGLPPPADGEVFENGHEQASRPPLPAARLPRDPVVTGAVSPAEPSRKQTTPVPRPRPALAKANDAGRPAAESDAGVSSARPDEAKADAAGAEAKAEAKVETGTGAKTEPKSGAKSGAKPGTRPSAAATRPGVSGPSKPEVAGTPDAGKPDVRVIDLSKPADAKKPEDKPGQAIQF